MAVAVQAPARPSARSALTVAGWIAAAVLTAALVTTGIGMVLGYRALVVRSGSMAPSVEAGDLLITKVVHPSAIAVGDVVTFRDPSRDQALVTHRVHEVVTNGSTYDFTTRGDANSGVERWTIGGKGSVGRLTFTVRGLRPLLGSLTRPDVRAVLLVAGAFILSAAALRRIWAR